MIFFPTLTAFSSWAPVHSRKNYDCTRNNFSLNGTPDFKVKLFRVAADFNSRKSALKIRALQVLF